MGRVPSGACWHCCSLTVSAVKGQQLHPSKWLSRGISISWEWSHLFCFQLLNWCVDTLMCWYIDASGLCLGLGLHLELFEAGMIAFGFFPIAQWQASQCCLLLLQFCALLWSAFQTVKLLLLFCFTQIHSISYLSLCKASGLVHGRGIARDDF